MHIAGNPQTLTAQQRELIELAATLGREKFAPRAATHDRDASFPFDNYQDLREAGLLKICVPKRLGGLGADFATYVMVAAEIGRHCGATALSWNMHVSSCMWSGFIADAMDMTPEQRADHEANRRIHHGNIVERGMVYSQPFSEGGAAAAGKAPWGTLAKPATLRGEGGYVVSGKKIFASLAGAADFYGVLCTPDKPGATQRDSLYLAVPAGAQGVSVVGDWDPLGMRGTVSRTLLLDHVFVPHSARLMPEGLYWQSLNRFPHMFATLSPTYMGIAQAAYDFTVPTCAPRCRACRRSSGACTPPSRSRWPRCASSWSRRGRSSCRTRATPPWTPTRTPACACTRRTTRSWKTPTRWRPWPSAPAAARACSRACRSSACTATAAAAA